MIRHGRQLGALVHLGAPYQLSCYGQIPASGARNWETLALVTMESLHGRSKYLSNSRDAMAPLTWRLNLHKIRDTTLTFHRRNRLEFKCCRYLAYYFVAASHGRLRSSSRRILDQLASAPTPSMSFACFEILGRGSMGLVSNAGTCAGQCNSRLKREVAGGLMGYVEINHQRFLLGADFLCPRASSSKTTPRRWIDRRGQFSLDDYSLLRSFDLRFCHWYGG